MKLAVYGSLRKGMGNHRYLRTSEYLGDDTIKGFDLYATLWDFPIVEVGKGEVKVEIYEVSSLDFENINRMETGARYTLVTADTKYGAVGVYVSTRELYRDCTLVPDGDWVEYKNNLGKEIL